MKFSISKEALLEGLQKVQHVVSTRTTLPILSNVLLVAKNGRLTFTTTDLDVGITGSVEAKIDKEGATTLPAKRLVSIVRELPASEVEVSVDSKNHASIRSGPSFFKIIGLGEAEFPPLPDFEGAKIFKIPQATLRDGLKKTSYAISTDETRYVLNGIFTSFRDGKMTLVATDGRRLCRARPWRRQRGHAGGAGQPGAATLDGAVFHAPRDAAHRTAALAAMPRARQLAAVAGRGRQARAGGYAGRSRPSRAADPRPAVAP